MLFWLFSAALSLSLCLAAGMYSYASNPTHRANQVFSLYCYSLAGWALCHVAMALPSAEMASGAYFWGSSFACLISALFLHFSVEFTAFRKWRPAWALALLYAMPVLFWLAWVCSMDFKIPMLATAWGFRPAVQKNWAYHGLVISMGLIFSMGVILIFHHALAAPAKEQRAQARWIAAGSLAMLAVGAVGDVFVGPDQSNFGVFGGTLMAVVTGYAIQRHEFLAMDPSQFASQIFKVLPSAVLLADSKGVVRAANPSALSFLGARQDKVLGEPVDQFLPRQFREPARMPSPSGFPAFASKLVPLDGTPMPVRLFIVPLRFGARSVGTMYVAQDQRPLQHLEDQMHQAQKMAALGQLAGGVAHDFNNILQVILAESQMLGRLLEPNNPTLAERAEEIKKTASRASGLTRQLLAFSRKQVLQPVPLNLNRVITDNQVVLQSLVGRRTSLDLNLSADLDLVKADPSQIEQVLINLAANARDAMPQGGHLYVTTANRMLAAGLDDMQEAILPGPYVLMAVGDSGTGMDKDTRDHLFEPFFTTKEPGKGTGLGLATVQGIVRQSGGHIFVRSRAGEGTTFEIHLPRTEAQAPAAALPEMEIGEPAAQGGGETILVVDDEEALRGVVADILREKGYAVVEAASGMEALKTPGLADGKISLLLTDVVMAGMSGPDLARQIIAKAEGLRVVFMSGFVGKQGLGQDLGNIAGFLAKPFTAEQLISKVREALRQGGKAAA